MRLVDSPDGCQLTPAMRGARVAGVGLKYICRLVVLMAALGLPAVFGAGSATAAPQACTGNPNAAQPIDLPVQGQDAHGLYVLPARPARTLVVFGHGYSYNDEAWVAHMVNAANIDGAVAVTMNYRGLIDLPKDSTGYPRSRGWPVAAGAQDEIAAGRYFDASCGPFDRIILLGVSMGGNSTGMAAAAQARRIDGQPLFDYWVGIEGVYNLIELYNEATLVAPSNQFAAQAKSDIEAETGGTPATAPQAYAFRTVVDRTADIASSGLKGVYVVHAVNDGEAAYNQAQEQTSGLRGAGVPTDLYTVTRHAPGDDQNIDTTLAGAPGGSAGHEAEWSTHDIVLDTGFDRITALLIRGEPPPCNRNFTVDGMANPRISPDPATRVPGCPPGQRVAPTSSSGLGPIASPRSRCSSSPQLSASADRGRRRVVLHGRARAGRCRAAAARVTAIRVALARPLGVTGRCRFVRPHAKLSRPRSCARAIFLRARLFTRGRRRGSWQLALSRPPRGHYRLTVMLREAGGPSARVDRRLNLG